MVPVSVVAVEPNTVTALRTPERDGYTAVQVGAGTAKQADQAARWASSRACRASATCASSALDDIADYEVGQTLDVTLFAEGESVDVTGVSQGQGLLRHHQAPPLPARPRDARLRLASRSRARSAAARPRQGVQGHAAWPATWATTASPSRRRPSCAADAERNLLLDQGPACPGARNALDHGQEGLAMPSTTLYTKTGAEAGTVDLPEALFAAPVNEAVHAPGRRRAAGRPPDRHGRHQDPRRGPRRRRQAVPPEGHRPCPPGLAQRTALRGRRRGLRPAPAQLRAAPAQAHEAPRPPGRADRPSSATAPSRSSTTSASTRIKTRELVGYLDALKAARPRARGRGRQRRAAWSCRPATCPASIVIRADSLNVVDVLNADTLLITQPSLPTMAEVYA